MGVALISQEELYKADIKIVETDLKMLVAIQSSQGHRNFYDELHFSPLKVSDIQVYAAVTPDMQVRVLIVFSF